MDAPAIKYSPAVKKDNFGRYFRPNYFRLNEDWSLSYLGGQGCPFTYQEVLQIQEAVKDIVNSIKEK